MRGKKVEGGENGKIIMGGKDVGGGGQGEEKVKRWRRARGVNNSWRKTSGGGGQRVEKVKCWRRTRSGEDQEVKEDKE